MRHESYLVGNYNGTRYKNTWGFKLNGNLMEDKGIFQSILERFSLDMKTDSILGEEIASEIMKLIEEDHCKKDTLEKILKTIKIKDEDS